MDIIKPVGKRLPSTKDSKIKSPYSLNSCRNDGLVFTLVSI